MQKTDDKKTNITRSMIDDVYRRNNSNDSYKKRCFRGKKIVEDEYTGERLHYSSKRYFTTKTTANVDHIVPLDELKQRYGNKISLSELKRIANSDYNLAVTSENLNKAKGKLSNYEYIVNKIKNGDSIKAEQTFRMVSQQIYSEMRTGTEAIYAMGIESAEDLGKKAGESFSKGIKGVTNFDINAASKMAQVAKTGISAALITFAVSAINNLALVGAGEKNTGEAVHDVSVECGGSFASAGGIELAQETVAEVCEAGISKNWGVL